jgi:hypothetical protein
LVTGVLVAARGLVGSAQLIAAVTLRWNRPFAPTLATMSLAASAVLVALETGVRLVPSDADPTFRWWLVAGYAAYAVLASSAVTSIRRPE